MSKATGEEIFVRFYTEGYTDMSGRFVARLEDVAHLSDPNEIRELLGLPFTPTSMATVKLPKGMAIVEGVINKYAIPTEGRVLSGGGWQTYLNITNNELDKLNFIFLKELK